MLRARLVEERIVELYRQNRITGGCYSGIGNEATAVGMSFAMHNDDVLVPTHRDMGAHLVRGHSALEIFRQYFKRESSQTRGKDSGLHLGREGSNIVGMISHLAHMLPVAVGVALAERQKGRPAFVVTTVGDGASSLGDFHESLNFAAVQKLPVLFVIENNQYAYSTPVTLQYACEHLSDRAKGYGMAGEEVDGTDVVLVLDAARRARERGMRGEGPTLINAVTMRMRGHSEHDDFKYVPKSLLDAWAAYDPLKRLEAVLEARSLATNSDLSRWRESLGQELDRAVEEAWAEPEPKGEEAAEDVYRRWESAWTPATGAQRWGSLT
jgi:TPP-dependent pyruvate/acetoin dehydrogenase alpha subunit